MAASAERVHLRLVREAGESAHPGRWFCGSCGGAPRDPSAAPAPSARVCASCGMGVLLEARADLAPAEGEPFLIADSALAICAVSAAAEALLGVAEADAVHRPLDELVAPADAEAVSQPSLAMLVGWAASGEDAPTRTVLRPANVFGVRFGVRIGPCGPPRAALVVFDA